MGEECSPEWAEVEDSIILLEALAALAESMISLRGDMAAVLQRVEALEEQHRSGFFIDREGNERILYRISPDPIIDAFTEEYNQALEWGQREACPEREAARLNGGGCESCPYLHTTEDLHYFCWHKDAPLLPGSIDEWVNSPAPNNTPYWCPCPSPSDVYREH